MHIALAQTRPTAGDVATNIRDHIRLVEYAINHQAEYIFFPELSVTGYEPTLAKKLAMRIDDDRLDVFQELSDKHRITICVGAPTQQRSGVCISMIIFQPQQSRSAYFKKYLHADEEPFFVPGENSFATIGDVEKISLAICYEISIDEHHHNAIKHDTIVYLASVAKSEKGTDAAYARLSAIAKSNSVKTAMVNCVGINDGVDCAGRSAVWNNDGSILFEATADGDQVLLFKS
jgi:predicted amidohydrolase